MLGLFMSQDYYQILGISKSASADEIKQAYRKLALKYHPDRGGGAEAEKKFKEINEAYQVLSDNEKRQRYDQFGSAAFRGGNTGGSSASGFDFSGFGSSGFGFSGFDFGEGLGDIFGDFFGSAFSQVQAEIHVSPAQAALGEEVNIEVNGEKISFKIPAGVQSGDSFRLPGKGKKMRNGRTGDLILTVKIITPKNLTHEQRELWEQIRQAETKKKHWWN